MALLSSNASVVSSAGAGEGETVVRLALCQQVIDDMQPNADKWGVSILNFQLESTTIADAKYARDYEEASLAMAKAKANLRASQAQVRSVVCTALCMQRTAVLVSDFVRFSTERYSSATEHGRCRSSAYSKRR
jgi:hypothetical protein